ncbi:hypothetical protein AM493_17240 [Flavobacterium akiainvivens]|uniref:CAAX prenyl protease 2/Lysostaphin resistance protein A-like domain-containing protein n=1 Tax=Flavobacterium akiainvivens TaxID=1202724 RepID=A0A0M8MKB1_9FLAO|nr:type II CAAX endopeptidase family protein [Flavobacterium akiainvivens]KOS07587.1 hypothetical protein AM493_17240 [Flavobacterium akiainvivens]SFQ22270.1 hypothetical protein SAMN05444144_10228 [Flavobacterium akiainvivens]
MKNRKELTTLAIVITGFVAYYILFEQFAAIKVWLDGYTNQGLTSYIITYFIVGVPVFLATYFLNRKPNVFSSLGLGKNILTGIVAAFVVTLPMFIGGLAVFSLKSEIDIENLLAGTLVAGFFEELYFRGFLFGQVFKNTKLGFIPAIFIGALVFASGHLYQSTNIIEMAGIFAITFFGAIFFAWLYAEWNYNLWMPIFTHAFMNLSWGLFTDNSNALGGWAANIFRVLTIAAAITITLLYKKRKGQKPEINRYTVLLKP